MQDSLFRTQEFKKTEATIRYLLGQAANMNYQDLQHISYYDRNFMIEAIAASKTNNNQKSGDAEYYGKLEATRNKNLAQ